MEGLLLRAKSGLPFLETIHVGPDFAGVKGTTFFLSTSRPLLTSEKLNTALFLHEVPSWL